MKTIYIHGFGGTKWQGKLEILKENGLEPFALQLTYDHESFARLKDYILENQIEFLIGQSHGGFMAFWLAEELGLPCLLTNPHLSLRAKKKVSPKVSRYACPLCLVALGNEDKAIDYTGTLKYLEEDKRADKITKVRIFEGQGHGFPRELYSKIVAWSILEVNAFHREKS